MGVSIDFCTELDRDPSPYDLAHLFHLDRVWENLAPARRLRDAGVPIALSPIWWPTDGFDRAGRAGLQGWLARRFGTAAYRDLRLLHHSVLGGNVRDGRIQWDHRSGACTLLDAVDVVLPNSRAEERALGDAFGPLAHSVVVPNAADGRFFDPPADGAASAPREGVLCAGRLDPRKNQLELIRALRGGSIALTIVGSPGRFGRAYAARCRREADECVRFLPHADRESLKRLYRAAKVHACPSWYETPGLVSLEAALCGCVVVATRGGSTSEYLGEDAIYCAPGDRAGIRAAVEQALTARPSARLRERILTSFTWRSAAERTLDGYQLAVSRRAPAWV